MDAYYFDNLQKKNNNLKNVYTDLVRFFAVKYLKIYIDANQLKKNNYNTLKVYNEETCVKYILLIFLKYWTTFFRVNFSQFLGHFLYEKQNNKDFVKLLEFLSDLKLLTYLDKYGWKIKDKIDIVLKNFKNTLIFLYEQESKDDIRLKVLLSKESARRCRDYIDQQKAEKLYKIKYFKFINEKTDIYVRKNYKMFDDLENTYINRIGIKDILIHINLLLNEKDKMDVVEMSAPNKTNSKKRARTLSSDERRTKVVKRDLLKDFETIKKNKEFLPLKDEEAFINNIIDKFEKQNFYSDGVDKERTKEFLKTYFFFDKNESISASQFNEVDFKKMVRQQAMLCKYNILYQRNGRSREFYFKNSTNTIVINYSIDNTVTIFKESYGLDKDIDYGIIQPELIPASVFYNIFSEFKNRRESYLTTLGNRQQTTGEIPKKFMNFKNILKRFSLSPSQEYDKINYNNRTLLNNVKLYNATGVRQSNITAATKGINATKKYYSIEKILGSTFTITSPKKLYYWISNVIYIVNKLVTPTSQVDKQRSLREIVDTKFKGDRFTTPNLNLKNNMRFVTNVMNTVIAFCIKDTSKYVKGGDIAPDSSEKLEISLNYKILIKFFIDPNVDFLQEQKLKFFINSYRRENDQTDSIALLKMFAVSISREKSKLWTHTVAELCRTELFLEFTSEKEIERAIESIKTLEENTDPYLFQTKSKYRKFEQIRGRDFNEPDELSREILNITVPNKIAQMFLWRPPVREDGTTVNMNFEKLLKLLKLGIPIIYVSRDAGDQNNLFRKNIYEIDNDSLKLVINHLCFSINPEVLTKEIANEIYSYLETYKENFIEVDKVTEPILTIFKLSLRNLSYKVFSDIFTYYNIKEVNTSELEQRIYNNEDAVVVGKLKAYETIKFLNIMNKYYKDNVDSFMIILARNLGSFLTTPVFLDIDFSNFYEDIRNNSGTYRAHLLLNILSRGGTSNPKSFITKLFYHAASVLDTYMKDMSVLVKNEQQFVDIVNRLKTFKTFAYNNIEKRVENYIIDQNLKTTLTEKEALLELKQNKADNLLWSMGIHFFNRPDIVKPILNLGLGQINQFFQAGGEVAGITTKMTWAPITSSFVTAAFTAYTSYQNSRLKINEAIQKDLFSIQKLQETMELAKDKVNLSYLVRSNLLEMETIQKNVTTFLKNRNTLLKDRLERDSIWYTLASGFFASAGIPIPSVVQDNMQKFAQLRIIQENPIPEDAKQLLIQKFNETGFQWNSVKTNYVACTDLKKNEALLNELNTKITKLKNIIEGLGNVLWDWEYTEGIQDGYPYEIAGLDACDGATLCYNSRGSLFTENDLAIHLEPKKAQLGKLIRQRNILKNKIRNANCKVTVVNKVKDVEMVDLENASTTLGDITNDDEILNNSLEIERGYYTTIFGIGGKVTMLYLKYIQGVKNEYAESFFDDFLNVNSLISASLRNSLTWQFLFGDFILSAVGEYIFNYETFTRLERGDFSKLVEISAQVITARIVAPVFIYFGGGFLYTTPIGNFLQVLIFAGGFTYVKKSVKRSMIENSVPKFYILILQDLKKKIENRNLLLENRPWRIWNESKIFFNLI